MKDTIVWADIFPQLQAHPTNDPRIFQLPFTTVERKQNPLYNIKAKKYFCCVVGGDCYGVEVYRQIGVNSKKECEAAYFKVKEAADYYEQHGTWPPNPNEQFDKNASLKQS